jgi:hypothetical protein
MEALAAGLEAGTGAKLWALIVLFQSFDTLL